MENIAYKYLKSYGELVGKSHVAKNIPCQDKAICLQRNQVSAAVLSDGCGSSEFSHFGAKITVTSISELLVEKFDELYMIDLNKNQLNFRKTIVDTVIEAEIKFITENPERFNDYKDRNIKQYNEYVEHNTEDSFFLQSLNATLLFFAEKNGRYLMGRIGDGVIGVILDDKLKIVLEESKTSAKNETFYTNNIYDFAKNDENWYLHSAFEVRKPLNANINGVILTSDGVEAFFRPEGDNFHKRYRDLNPLFSKIIEAITEEDSNKILYDEYLPWLVNQYPFDDCSIAILISPDYQINEFVVKEYPRPPMDEDDSIEQTSTEIVAEEEKIEVNQVVLIEDLNHISQEIMMFIPQAEKLKVIVELMEYHCQFEDANMLLVLQKYKQILEIIKQDGYFSSRSTKDDLILGIIKRSDSNLIWNETGEIRRFEDEQQN